MTRKLHLTKSLPVCPPSPFRHRAKSLLLRRKAVREVSPGYWWDDEKGVRVPNPHRQEDTPSKRGQGQGEEQAQPQAQGQVQESTPIDPQQALAPVAEAQVPVSDNPEKQKKMAGALKDAGKSVLSALKKVKDVPDEAGRKVAVTVMKVVDRVVEGINKKRGKQEGDKGHIDSTDIFTGLMTKGWKVIGDWFGGSSNEQAEDIARDQAEQQTGVSGAYTIMKVMLSTAGWLIAKGKQTLRDTTGIDVTDPEAPTLKGSDGTPPDSTEYEEPTATEDADVSWIDYRDWWRRTPKADRYVLEKQGWTEDYMFRKPMEFKDWDRFLESAAATLKGQQMADLVENVLGLELPQGPMSNSALASFAKQGLRDKVLARQSAEAQKMKSTYINTQKETTEQKLLDIVGEESLQRLRDSGLAQLLIEGGDPDELYDAIENFSQDSSVGEMRRLAEAVNIREDHRQFFRNAENPREMGHAILKRLLSRRYEVPVSGQIRDRRDMMNHIRRQTPPQKKSLTEAGTMRIRAKSLFVSPFRHRVKRLLAWHTKAKTPPKPGTKPRPPIGTPPPAGQSEKTRRLEQRNQKTGEKRRQASAPAPAPAPASATATGPNGKPIAGPPSPPSTSAWASLHKRPQSTGSQKRRYGLRRPTSQAAAPPPKEPTPPPKQPAKQSDKWQVPPVPTKKPTTPLQRITRGGKYKTPQRAVREEYRSPQARDRVTRSETYQRAVDQWMHESQQKWAEGEPREKLKPPKPPTKDRAIETAQVAKGSPEYNKLPTAKVAKPPVPPKTEATMRPVPASNPKRKLHITDYYNRRNAGAGDKLREHARRSAESGTSHEDFLKKFRNMNAKDEERLRTYYDNVLAASSGRSKKSLSKRRSKGLRSRQKRLPFGRGRSRHGDVSERHKAIVKKPSGRYWDDERNVWVPDPHKQKKPSKKRRSNVESPTTNVQAAPPTDPEELDLMHEEVVETPIGTFRGFMIRPEGRGFGEWVPPSETIPVTDSLKRTEQSGNLFVLRPEDQVEDKSAAVAQLLDMYGDPIMASAGALVFGERGDRADIYREAQVSLMQSALGKNPPDWQWENKFSQLADYAYLLGRMESLDGDPEALVRECEGLVRDEVKQYRKTQGKEKERRHSYLARHLRVYDAALRLVKAVQTRNQHRQSVGN